MVIRHYRDLVAWQKAMDAAEMVYSVTGSCPEEESDRVLESLAEVGRVVNGLYNSIVSK